MDIENSKAQMKKGILELCILTIISRGEAYASDIIVELKKVNLIVVEGTLYPLLTRLKNEDLLIYNWFESNIGPPRKYYKLTKNGQQFLNEINQSWIDLVNSVNTITKNKNEQL
jgi:PadR family transcriptional regulator PadR